MECIKQHLKKPHVAKHISRESLTKVWFLEHKFGRKEKQKWIYIYIFEGSGLEQSKHESALSYLLVLWCWAIISVSLSPKIFRITK